VEGARRRKFGKKNITETRRSIFQIGSRKTKEWNRPFRDHW
jgi:hypothetical protein